MLQDSGDHAFLPWLMVALAAAYLAIMRLPQSAVASAIHLSIAVVLLTIAVPLKASGHWITISWLVEGLALLWVATRLAPHDSDDESGYASSTLRWLGSASLALGFAGVCIHITGLLDIATPGLWNQANSTALIAIAVFAAAAWLAQRAATAPTNSNRRIGTWDHIAWGSFLLIAGTATQVTLREFRSFWFSDYSNRPHPAFQSPDFVMALIALAIFAGVVAVSLHITRRRPSESFWLQCAALSTIAFNLIAILTGVREIIAIWGNTSAITPDAALQQALAISAYLMLYGAALLAAGFWRRSGFLRWQALLLLLFTICKTFLYDMRDRGEGLQT
jgi:uncharacterized membrane protein